MARFAAKLVEENTSWDEEMERTIFYIEKELKVHIDENYPLIKFYSQVEKLKEHIKKEEEENKKMQNSTRSLGR